MDVNNLIAGALTAGLNEISKATASQAVKDSYLYLKDLIKDKIGKMSGKKEIDALDSQVDSFEKDPQTYKKSLVSELAKTGIEADHDIRRAAESLLKLIEQSSKEAKVKQVVNVSGSVNSIQNIGPVGGDLNIGDMRSKDE